MSESRNELKKEFQDKEYREAYAEDFLNTSIATQLVVLRERRGLTQEQLAQKIGTNQYGISRIENVNYSAWNIRTLKKIAFALGVRLKVSFETFGSLLNEAVVFSREALERPAFEEDPIFHESVETIPLESQAGVAAGEINAPSPLGMLPGAPPAQEMISRSQQQISSLLSSEKIWGTGQRRLTQSLFSSQQQQRTQIGM